MNIDEILLKDKKIYHTKELMAVGLTYYKINKLVDEGWLIRLNKSYYENNYFEGEDNDFYYVTAYTPEGVVCLLSAAVYYRLTNFRPDSIDVAVPKKKNVSTLPDWPVFKMYYFEKNRYDLGIKNIISSKDGFKIYDIEKTVVDILYYRNKIGIEETKEILTNYLSRQDRNLNKLIQYSEKLKCHDILKSYLEVLV
ncbi:type IV toxin-antitoxin system AbiEi family antitoxin [Fusibacter sp. 3D3]|uniref:type IV toxin-antitoxin system AbiEi family antitoxin domain-containing protein n=1 Tax=Fusibacter sp. 3D3 TaxID=1048380 RepID=UPI0008533F2F|nr:type IV toxin-antitoxin system AbiEi family antitoxin [Fusibacter sp. 3D3]GAU79035.1 hypothetical protein F3D3_3671 [Fusibacter sp. 3D3]